MDNRVQHPTYIHRHVICCRSFQTLRRHFKHHFVANAKRKLLFIPTKATKTNQNVPRMCSGVYLHMYYAYSDYLLFLQCLYLLLLCSYTYFVCNIVLPSQVNVLATYVMNMAKNYTR
jgi:hypothetical protein